MASEEVSTIRKMTQSEGPYRLLTVNTAPERAKIVIGRVIQELRDRYAIEHVGNCENIQEVEEKVKHLTPNLLFSASMWTAEEAAQIQNIARAIVPDIKTHAIPFGLQAETGPDGVVEYLKKQIPTLLG